MKKAIFCLFISALFIGCKHDGSHPSVHAPTAAALVFPAQNSLCTTGTITSTTQASISLTWDASAYTNSYVVHIKNLSNGNMISQTVTSPLFNATLQRGMPYSWYVVSKSNANADTAVSVVWKFYVAGTGTVSYSPFPAELVSPSYSQVIVAGTTTVELSWTGSDVDNDIASYDVYFGSTNNPPLLQAVVTNMYLKNIPVSANTVYYWKIVTKDSAGNTSTSDISQFRVD